MARSKQKVGRFGRSDGFEEVPPDEDVATDPLDKKNDGRPGRPRREARERIEVRDEERTLTRELADWDSYQDELDLGDR